MKVALLAVLGLALGALGGAALGIGAGLTWIGMARTSGLDSGTLVFFTFMPLGAAIGGIGGALLFAVVAIRDAEKSHLRFGYSALSEATIAMCSNLAGRRR